MSLDLIAFGSTFLELVFGHVPRLPGPGEEIFTEELALSCGGAITVADAAARSGARAGLAVRLGSDLGSRIVEEHSLRAGIDLSPSIRVAWPTAGVTIVLNFDGDRAFISHLPPGRAEEPPEAERWLAVLREVRPTWCYLHAGAGIAPLLRQARSIGVKIALDCSLAAIETSRDAVIDCALLADVLVPNESELARLTGLDEVHPAASSAMRWCSTLVVKRGAKGALAVHDHETEEVTAGLRRVRVRDRTGAGDAFAGAMIGALAQGVPLLDAVAAGNAAGSDAVARLGGVGEVEVEGFAFPAAEATRNLRALLVPLDEEAP